MLDLNIATGILVAVAIVVFVTFGIPLLRERGHDNIYTDVKAGLLLFGYAFRDEKVKAITDLIINIVREMEKLNIAAPDKQEQAINIAFRTLMKDFNLDIDEEAIKIIIKIAVSYLPATN